MYRNDPKCSDRQVWANSRGLVPNQIAPNIKAEQFDQGLHYLPFRLLLLGTLLYDRTTLEPCHEIMVLFVLRKRILQTRMRSHPVGARYLIVGRTLRLLPYFICANSEGSGETARMCMLAWVFAGRLCDKYHNLKSWLIVTFFGQLQQFFGCPNLSDFTVDLMITSFKLSFVRLSCPGSVLSHSVLAKLNILHKHVKKM